MVCTLFVFFFLFFSFLWADSEARGDLDSDRLFEREELEIFGRYDGGAEY